VPRPVHKLKEKVSKSIERRIKHKLSRVKFKYEIQTFVTAWIRRVGGKNTVHDRKRLSKINGMILEEEKIPIPARLKCKVPPNRNIIQ